MGTGKKGPVTRSFHFYWLDVTELMFTSLLLLLMVSPFVLAHRHWIDVYIAVVDDEDGVVLLLSLFCCYRLPDSEEGWLKMLMYPSSFCFMCVSFPLCPLYQFICKQTSVCGFALALPSCMLNEHLARCLFTCCFLEQINRNKYASRYSWACQICTVAKILCLEKLTFRVRELFFKTDVSSHCVIVFCFVFFFKYFF